MSSKNATLSNRRQVSADELDDVMEFECVIFSHGDGTVSDVTGLFAPAVDEYEALTGVWTEPQIVGNDDWSLITGFTGQYGYNGASFHASEYVGGALAQHILDTEGFYVVVIPSSTDLSDELVDADSWVLATREA